MTLSYKKYTIAYICNSVLNPFNKTLIHPYFSYMSKKVLIFHDTFLMKGGAERMNIEMAKILDADIATTLWHPDCYNPREMGFQGKIFEMHPKFRRGMLGFLQMKLAFIRCGKHSLTESERYMQGKSSMTARFENYDTILFSNEALSAVWNTPKTCRTTYYAHSISRHLFDQKSDYRKKIPLIFRPLFTLFVTFLQWLYRKEIERVDHVYTNSPTNVRRIASWLGREDAVFLPPFVDTEEFSPSKSAHLDTAKYLPKSYDISFSRLTHAKCVDSIIRAYRDIPERNILILAGKYDSQRAEFFALAGVDEATNISESWIGGRAFTSKIHPNITFLTLDDNTLLPAYIARARVSICISKQEDFGMVAIESMACGTPVVAVDEGGYTETVLDGKTGWLIDSKDRTKSLKKWLLSDVQIESSHCIQAQTRAEVFSKKQFQTRVRGIVFG